MSELVLTLRQPAQVGEKARSDFVLGTQSYLPGTVVRGAFAAAWIAAHGEPATSSPARSTFLRLFEGGVRFGPLFCGSEFLPLSVFGHKYPEPGTNCGIAEWDGAIQDDVPEHCPDCGSPLEQVKGMRGGDVPVRRRTSVAITSSGVAQRGQIVTRDTLEAGLAFQGALFAGDPGWLDDLASLGQVRVGGRRTTHGTADVRIHGEAPPPALQRRDDGLLVLRLRSPGIFVDDHGRPSREPSASELEEALGSPARVTRQWTRWQPTGGWHMASGLPKPVDLAVTPGSTYLVQTDPPASGEALARLASRGLGLRRHEGFGDLAPPPALLPGRIAREARARERTRMLDGVVPLRRLQTAPELWHSLVAGLAAHAVGDDTATASLRKMAQQPPDPGIGAALARFLSLSPEDASYVAKELSGQ